VQATTSHDLGLNPHSPTLTVTVCQDWQGISLTVFNGPNHSSVLSRTFTWDRVDAGRVWFKQLRDSANAGQPVWRIEADAQALLAAATAVQGAYAEAVTR
jgi:hypothetical protein